MLLRLQRYNFELVYRPGPQMLIADMLSRASSDVTDKHDKSKLYDELAALGDEAADHVASQQTIDMIKRAADGDDQYCLLKQQILAGWPECPDDLPNDLKEFNMFADELAISDGLVSKGHRVVVPLGARQIILDRLHTSHIWN